MALGQFAQAWRRGPVGGHFLRKAPATSPRLLSRRRTGRVLRPHADRKGVVELVFLRHDGACDRPRLSGRWFLGAAIEAGGGALGGGPYPSRKGDVQTCTLDHPSALCALPEDGFSSRSPSRRKRVAPLGERERADICSDPDRRMAAGGADRAGRFPREEEQTRGGKDQAASAAACLRHLVAQRLGDGGVGDAALVQIEGRFSDGRRPSAPSFARSASCRPKCSRGSTLWLRAAADLTGTAPGIFWRRNNCTMPSTS